MEDRIHRQIRWYREPGDAPAESVVLKEFKGLPRHGQAALLELLGRFKKGAERRNEVEFFCNVPPDSKLYELRVRVGSDPFRILYFRDTPVHYVLVLAVYKNQQKLPQGDRERAIRRLKRWRDGSA